jgi:Holliday junction resolvase
MVNKNSKGKNAERDIVNLLKDQLGDKSVLVQRNLEQFRGKGVDIIIFPFFIEVKRQEKTHIDMWFRQLKAKVPEGGIPVLIYRKNNVSWKVVCELEDFIPTIRENLTSQKSRCD